MSKYGSLTSVTEIQSFKWEIPDILQSDKKSGFRLESPCFPVWDVSNVLGELKMVIYPRGRTAEDSNFVAIDLLNIGSSLFNLSCVISLEDKDGNKWKICALPTTKLKVSFGFRVSKFLNVDVLKKSQLLLPSGTLTVVLDIVKPGPKSPAACLIQDLELASLDREELSDMKIISHGKIFNCHKFMISARSPVLGAMCKGDFKEGSTGVINMDSLDSEIVKEMLSFIYTGKVLNLESNALELLKAADIYQLDNLKDICGHHLSCRLNADNCLDYLVLGDKYRVLNLKDPSMEFVKENINTLMMTPKWKEIKKENSELMMTLMETALQQKNN